MRKVIFSVASVLVVFLMSCNNETKTTETNTKPQKNLEASHVVNKAFETGDISQIDSVVAADFVDHTDRGDMGRDSLKAMIVMVRRDFPDMKMELIKEVADDEYVFSLMRFTGTSQGQMGMPVGPYDMKGLHVLRFNKEGKIAEHWEYMEMREMMKMMQQMQPQAGGESK